jgi:hypothetical protein
MRKLEKGRRDVDDCDDHDHDNNNDDNNKYDL